jgi:orotate phosphoribosyltransferase
MSSDYLSVYLNHPTFTSSIKKAKTFIPKIEFDSFAFRGMSGALLAPILAIKCKKHLIMIRKSIEGSHSNSMVEGYIKTKKFIIIDDFIESGNTVNTIIAEVKRFAPNAKCSGILLIGGYSRIPIFYTMAKYKKMYLIK